MSNTHYDNLIHLNSEFDLKYVKGSCVIPFTYTSRKSTFERHYLNFCLKTNFFQKNFLFSKCFLEEVTLDQLLLKTSLIRKNTSIKLVNGFKCNF